MLSSGGGRHHEEMRTSKQEHVGLQPPQDQQAGRGLLSALRGWAGLAKPSAMAALRHRKLRCDSDPLPPGERAEQTKHLGCLKGGRGGSGHLCRGPSLRVCDRPAVTSCRWPLISGQSRSAGSGAHSYLSPTFLG